MISSRATRDGYITKWKDCRKSTNIILQSCDSIVYDSQVYYQDTVFQNNYTAANGCDSIHSIVLDIASASNDTLLIVSCQPYFWNGTIYNSSGYYTHSFGPTSCDSMVTLDFTIGLDTSITIVSQNSLSANTLGAAYQWIDCNTMQIISGATTSTYTSQYPGSFACVVTKNGCSDTSGCHTLNFSPDGVFNQNIVSHLYPNPSTGSYNLELDKNYKDVSLEIRTISGQLIWTKNFAQLKQTTLNVDQAAGVYMLYIKQGEQMQVKKLLKW